MIRDTFKYHFKVGNLIVHGGITNNLLRRESVCWLVLGCLLSGDEDGSGGDQDTDNPLMMLFSEIHHFTDPTGRALSEPFLRLPSRRFVKLSYVVCYWPNLY